MSMPVWPPGLPQEIPQEGYRGTSADNVIRTAMDVGPPKTRRRSSARNRTFTVSFRFDQAEVTLFREFWRTTLEGGVLRFEFPDSEGGNDLIVIPTGPYTERAEGPTMRIGFSVEVVGVTT